MAKQTDLELEDHKAERVHDEELFRATVAFEHAALKPLPLLNGGAVIAVLTFAGNAAKDGVRAVDAQMLKWAISAWIVGLVASVLALFFGYFSQFSFRKAHSRKLEAALRTQEGRSAEAADQMSRHQTHSCQAFMARYAVYAMALVSLGAFALGALWGVDALQSPPPRPWWHP